MPEEQASGNTSDDGLSKEFDEIVTNTEGAESTQDDGAVVVDVRRDSTPEVPVIPSEPVVSPPEVIPVPVAPIAPVAAPAVPTHSTGGTMVLQWLSYAFWGWFGVAMSWLSGVTIAYSISGNSSDLTGALAYPLASVIVMFLLAVAADLFYARREPAQKSGGANAIMLVHVVLFVLIAVGAAVTALFSLISMALNTDPTSGTDGQVIAAWTSLVVIVIFGLTAVRAMFGGRKKKIRIIHWAVMTALALGMIGASLFGPVVGAQLTKDDRIIEEGLPTLSTTINQYVTDKDKLPATLADANEASSSSTAASTSLVTRNIVKYTPNVKAATTDDYYNSGTTSKSLSFQKTYYYELCVTYKAAKKASGLYYDTSSVSSGKYTSYLSISSHPKGEVCYKLSTDNYGTVIPLDATAGATTSSSAKQ